MEKKSLFLKRGLVLLVLFYGQQVYPMVEGEHVSLPEGGISGESGTLAEEALQRQEKEQQKEQQERLREQHQVDVVSMLKNSISKSQGGNGGKGTSIAVTGQEKRGQFSQGPSVVHDDLGTVSITGEEKEALQKLAEGDHESLARRLSEQQQKHEEERVASAPLIQQKVEVVKTFREKLVSVLGKDFFKKSESLKTSSEYKNINETIRQFYSEFAKAHDQEAVIKLQSSMAQALEHIRGEKELLLESYGIAQKKAQGKLGVFKRIFTTAVPKEGEVKATGEQAKAQRQSELDRRTESSEILQREHSTALTRIRDIESKQKKIQKEFEKKPSFFRRSPEKKYKDTLNQLAKDKAKAQLDKNYLEQRPGFKPENARELPEQSFESGKSGKYSEGQLTLSSDLTVRGDRDFLQASQHRKFYDGVIRDLSSFRQNSSLVEGGKYVDPKIVAEINKRLEKLEHQKGLFQSKKGKEEADERTKKEISDLLEKAKTEIQQQRAEGMPFARYQYPKKEGNLPAEVTFMANPGDGENTHEWGFYTNRLDQHTSEQYRFFYKDLNRYFNEEVLKGDSEAARTLKLFSKKSKDLNFLDEAEEDVFFSIVARINRKLENLAQPGLTPKQGEAIQKSIWSDIDNMNYELENARHPARDLAFVS